MDKRILFIVLASFFITTGGLHATVCEADDAKCNLYDLSNIKVARANFIESKLRQNHPKFFNATGQKIQIRYVLLDKADDNPHHYAGHVNLQEMINAYTSRSPYVVYLTGGQDENVFRNIVSHEIGHVLNFVCVASRLESDYKHTSESFKKMIMHGTFRFSYFSDTTKEHDDRHVEQIADSFKEYVIDGKPIPREFLRELCAEK